jgi:hypothetical protein
MPKDEKSRKKLIPKKNPKKINLLSIFFHFFYLSFFITVDKTDIFMVY